MYIFTETTIENGISDEIDCMVSFFFFSDRVQNLEIYLIKLVLPAL